MSQLLDAIRRDHAATIASTDMRQVNTDLRCLVDREGLGVAILVAWQQGLQSGYIPLAADEPQVDLLSPDGVCPYFFVHVPVRGIRQNKAELARRGIMNNNPDVSLLRYHEDGLVCQLSFADPESVGLAAGDIRAILAELARRKLLQPIDLTDERLQFTSNAAEQRISADGPIYVLPDIRLLSRLEPATLPLPVTLDAEGRSRAWAYVCARLTSRSSCNFCSAEELTPHEATIHAQFDVAGPLVPHRDYEFGFTFAPFGDPREVCHFLAWDLASGSDRVLNMEPQPYSFSELGTLVRVINQDIANYCAKNRIPPWSAVSGACNHWAGNSIHHQHFQFFRIDGLPLVQAAVAEPPIATDQGVSVHRLVWPAPAYLISAAQPERNDLVGRVADRLAGIWDGLGSHCDTSMGNGIMVGSHTQNIFVTMDADRLNAFFIPRLRTKLHTTSGRWGMAKRNAGVAEMTGYFIVDEVESMDTLRTLSPPERKLLADGWLADLSPDVTEFEVRLRQQLTGSVP